MVFPDKETSCMNPWDWNEAYHPPKEQLIDPPDDISSSVATNDDFVPHELETRPRNTISKKLGVARLNCSVSNGFVQWWKVKGHESSVQLISHGDQIAHAVGSDITPDKFQIDQPTEGRFDLVLSNLQLSDAGTYVCYVGSRGGAPQTPDHEVLADNYTAPVELVVVGKDQIIILYC